MTPKLEPCYVCHRDDLRVYGKFSNMKIWYVKCLKCKSFGPIRRTNQGAIRAWNAATRRKGKKKMSDTTDRDYIAELQVRVGCIHKWRHHISGSRCVSCRLSIVGNPLDMPSSAPDCSTLYDAMRAAQMVGFTGDIEIGDWLMLLSKYPTEHAAAAAVCRLAIEELERREAANEPTP